MTISQNAQFGRAWRLEIETAPDSTGASQKITAFSDSWTPETLSLIFDTYQTTAAGFWYADISIYNLNAPTEQLILKQGMQVTLWAGYQQKPYGVIFKGTLFQPMWERQNVTDYRLTLHCIVGIQEDANNFVAIGTGQLLTQRDIIARMAANARTPINIESMDSEALSKTQYPRGQTLFGNPGKYFKEAAKAAGLNYWISGIGANVRSLRSATSVPTYSFGPDSGLVGTPQVTQDGVQCTVLLDPRIIMGEQIELKASNIRQQARVQGNYATILDRDGIYTVIGIRHRGDSRGQEWYSDLTCITSIGGKLALVPNIFNG